MSSTPTLDQSLVSDLRAAVSGEVVVDGDETYHDARAVWNGRVDRRPAAVVRVASTDDVAAAVGFAREHGLPLSVRGGGHHVSGSAVVDGGVVVDLSTLTEVEVDPDARIARVGAGCRVSDVLPAVQAHGLVFPTGSAADTGVAGSTLGGGIGWTRRTHGLAVDRLRSVEMVTVDGEVLTASADEHPDLFWGVRGGGANFGVVTAFEFDCLELGPEVAVAQAAYPAPDAVAVAGLFRAYRAYAADAPDEVTTLASYASVPPLPDVPAEFHGAPVVMVYGVYAGDPAEGEAALAPLRELGGGDPAMDLGGRMPYAAPHEMANGMFPSGRRYSWHSVFAAGLSDDLVDRLAGRAVDKPGPECAVTVWHLGGAVSDVPADATAYAWRTPSSSSRSTPAGPTPRTTPAT